MKPPKPLPPLDLLFERFYVDSTSPTGLRNAVAGHQRPLDGVAGWVDTHYGRVYVDGQHYQSHRVVHCMRTGFDDVEREVDHKDRNKLNNHPFNLRWANRSEQALNRATKHEYPGVYKRGNSWVLEIYRRKEGVRIYRRGFSSALEAHLRRQQILSTL